MIAQLLMVAMALVASQAQPNCPTTMILPESGGFGLWFLQYATPVAVIDSCSMLRSTLGSGFLCKTHLRGRFVEYYPDTSPICACISDNTTLESYNGTLLYVKRHYGYNTRDHKWDFLLMTALRRSPDSTHYIQRTQGIDEEYIMTFIGADDYQTFTTMMSCTLMPDPAGNMVQPVWIFTKEEYPPESVHRAALATVPEDITVVKIPRPACPR